MPTTTNWPESLRTVAIVGVGLIGGSLAAALHRVSGVKVIGVGRNPARLQAALAAGLVDEVTTDIHAALPFADLVVVCSPVDQIAHTVIAAAQSANGPVLTDAGSVKRSICAAVDFELPAPHKFVGAHPIAGSEKQGFEHADARLFDGKLCVLTPTAATSPEAVRLVDRFWRGVGMRVTRMSPQKHDAALAETSHLPHIVASVLAGAMSLESSGLAGTGFRDTSRVAAGDPALWRSILLENREQVLLALRRFEDSLATLRNCLETGDASGLDNLLRNGALRREQILSDVPHTSST